MIDAPIGKATQAYRDFLTRIGPFREQSVTAPDLDRLLQHLLPLTHAKTRRLLIPTNGRWTAFVQNGIAGSDPASVMPVLAKALNCMTMRVCAHTPDARYPATIWEVYAPKEMGGDRLCHRRALAAANDGGRWVFHNTGAPFPFEDQDVYAARRVRDRFTRAMLDRYLAEFQVPALGDDLFATGTERPAVSFEQHTWKQEPPEYTLEEARSGRPWQR